ncbi:hypothetical protein NQZ79_g2207 [Umbelopsis isabellina]|nr:hypothetical protein NQZ79_g2207 [Umbelopsis isabellina]
MPSLRILTKDQVDQLLEKSSDSNVTPQVEIINLMADTFSTFSNSPDLVQAPHRTTLQTPNHAVLYMPTRVDGMGTAMKVVGVPKNGKGGLPSTILVMNEATGELRAVVNAAALTAIRTAAGCALATMHLAARDASNMLVFGAGAQSIAHVDLIVAIRPSIKHVTVWNRSKERLESVLTLLREKHENIVFSGIVGNDEALEQAVRDAQIICTCTNSYEPVFNGKWVQPGTHINSVGSYRLDMQEIDQVTVALPRKIVVDSREACKIEAGEHVQAINDGHRNPDTDWLEIGELVKKPELVTQARQSDSDITIFKSVGVGAQDVAIAELIVRRAEHQNIGQLVDA